MRRIKTLFTVLITLGVLIIGYQLFHIDNRYFLDDNKYIDYQPSNDYQTTYPVGNYVDEQMNAHAIIRSGLIGSMVNFDVFVDQNVELSEKFKVFGAIVVNHNQYTKITQEDQYQEKTPITLSYVGEQETHNYQYQGVLADGTKVTGNVAIWGQIDNANVAISFQNADGTIDENKARLLADDSNSEMLAYLVIEELQGMLETDYEPNVASEQFFGCTVEELAGSISYHATTSLVSLTKPVGEVAIERSKTANISTYDDDSFIVNRSF